MAQGDAKPSFVTLTLTMPPELYMALVGLARDNKTSWMEECRKAIAAVVKARADVGDAA
jgi:hypothetical protein